MIVKCKKDISEQELIPLKAYFAEHKYSVTVVRTDENTYCVVVGKKVLDIRCVGNLPGVVDVFRVSDPFKLVSGKWRKDRTVIDLGDGVKVGQGHFSMMMGPCSIESEEQVHQIVEFLCAHGVKIMRGGAFKPRSSPYSFQGLGMDGLRMFAEIAHSKGLKIITEVLEPSQIDAMIPFVDIFQVGARNNQNFNLLKALGGTNKPVLLKRGISGTLEELLNAAEYIYINGNEKILLCERGIRTFESAYRNVLDINAVPVLRAKSHLPVIVDPSHAIGIRQFVEPVALASMMAGADGIIVESHIKPHEALSDGQQTLNFSESRRLINKINCLYETRKMLDELDV
jgi:3-deoxy-7-phosphoheptulonate synthase